MIGGGYDPDGLRHGLQVTAVYYMSASVAFIVIGISGWIFGTRMRRRIKKDLGRAADNSDLASLGTWMKVDEVEEKKNPGHEWVPDSIDLGPDDQRRIELFPNKNDRDLLR
jgi:hypothetical protein